MTETIDRQFEMWVVQQLGTGIATVDFIKKDGTARKMNCTLQVNLIPEDKRPKEVEVVEVKEGKAPEACRVFDVDKQDWRSFRWDSLKGLSIGGNVVFNVGEF